MSEYVPGMIVLVGKVAFLVALYGFVLVVFRGLMVEARRAGRPVPRLAPTPPGAPRQWELRPPEAAGVTLHPPAPPVLTPPLTGAAAPVLTPAPHEAAGPAIELHPPSPPVLTPAQNPETAEEEGGEAPGDAEARGEAEAPAEPGVEAAAAAEPVGEPEPEPAPGPVLVVLTSPEANLERGARLTLADATRLGRAEDNDIILRDRFVSAHHAEVVSMGDGFVLRDLGSTNGTFCNGVRVTGEVALREGDRIGIGTSVFAFHRGQ